MGASPIRPASRGQHRQYSDHETVGRLDSAEIDLSLHVTFVVPVSGGGLGRHVHSLAGGLIRRGVQVSVCIPSFTERRFRFRDLGAHVVIVEISDRPRPVRDLLAIWRLHRVLSRPNVVHAHGLRAGALAAIATIGRRSPPLVVTLHNAVMAGGLTRFTYAVLERIVVRRAALVLAVSADLAARARRLRARVVEPGLVPAPALPPAARTPESVRTEVGAEARPLLLTICRLAQQKGLLTLLDAAAGWKNLTPPPLVVVVGSGPLEAELASRIRAGELPVRLLGHRDDVADLLAAADVLVVPSLWEGQPLIVQEGLRAGRPIVASQVGGIPALVGDAGLLVSPGDPAELRAAVVAVLEDPSLVNRLARAARQRSVGLATEDDAINQVMSVYRRVTGVEAVS
jgi:glycosyltransferase involved in cell wall biosynthesis